MVASVDDWAGCLESAPAFTYCIPVMTEESGERPRTRASARHWAGTPVIETLLLGSLAAGVLFWRLGEGALRDWDEALYAQVAREMVEGGNWLTLSWNAQPYFKKPPLLFWTIALSYRVFDVGEWSTRLPSVLFGLGSVLLVGLLGRQLYGRFVGLVAGALLLTLYPFLTHGSRQSATDAPLLFCSLLALFCAWRGRRHGTWLIGIGIAIGVGVLAKGVAALLPLLLIGLFYWQARELSVLRSGFFWRGIGGGLCCALPWYLYQVGMHGLPFVQTFIQAETLTRLLTTYDAPTRPWYFYFATLWEDVFHCLPLIIGFSLLALTSWWKKEIRISSASHFLFCWLVGSLLLVLSTRTQHAWYLLPVYPPLCIFIAGMGVRLGYLLYSSPIVRSSPGLFLRQAAFAAVLGWFLCLFPDHVRRLPVQLVWVDDFYQGRNILLQELSHQPDPGVPLYAVGVQMPGVVFYSRRATTFLSEAELANLPEFAPPLYALAPAYLGDRLGEKGLSLLRQERDWLLFAHLPVEQTALEEQEFAKQEMRTDEL